MKRPLAIAVTVASLFVGSLAHASTIVLSEFSSEPGLFPASDLDATLTFDLSGAQLTLTATNLTDVSLAFDITKIYFSASSNVTGLSLVSAPTHSTLGTSLWGLNASTGEGGPTHGDGFGVHDFSLIGLNVGMGQNKETGEIASGDSVAFVFTISGTGPFSMSDFTTELSAQTTGGTNTLTLAAAKFQDEDSAFGGSASSAFVIPEPATAALLALAAVVLRHRRRR